MAKTILIMATTVAPEQKNGVAKKEAPKKAVTTASKKTVVKPIVKKEDKVIPLDVSLNTLTERKERFKEFFSLQEKHEKLTNTNAKLSQLINQNDPIDGSLQLILKEKGSNDYRNEEAFLTTNQEIIAEALKCLKTKVDFMLDEVKQEILEASI